MIIIEDPEKFILSQVKIQINWIKVNTEWDLFSNIGIFAGKRQHGHKRRGKVLPSKKLFHTDLCFLGEVFSCAISIFSVLIICWLRSLTSSFSFLRSAASADGLLKSISVEVNFHTVVKLVESFSLKIAQNFPLYLTIFWNNLISVAIWEDKWSYLHILEGIMLFNYSLLCCCLFIKVFGISVRFLLLPLS